LEKLFEFDRLATPEQMAANGAKGKIRNHQFVLLPLSEKLLCGSRLSLIQHHFQNMLVSKRSFIARLGSARGYHFVLEFDRGMLLGFASKNAGPLERRCPALPSTGFAQEILSEILHLITSGFGQHFDDLRECHTVSFIMVILTRPLHECVDVQETGLRLPR